MSDNSILKQRISKRDFSERIIPLNLLKEIVEAAQLAPSWENTQPWKAYLAVGKSLQELKKSHKRRVEDGEKSWTEVTPPLKWAAYPQQNIDTWMAGIKADIGEAGMEKFIISQADLFKAAAIVYITIPKESSHYSAYDAGAFGYGLLLAAAERGISGIPAYEFIRFPKEVREVFEIPEDESLFMGVAFGYPAENSALNTIKANRNPIEDILQIRE